jgi:hypothetical protein
MQITISDWRTFAQMRKTALSLCSHLWVVGVHTLQNTLFSLQGDHRRNVKVHAQLQMHLYSSKIETVRV